MIIKRNFDLSPLNTFGISAKAAFFTEITTEEDIKELFLFPEFKQNDKLFLGGGSNVLFTKDFEGLVILNKLKGIKILSDDPHSVLVRSMAGEIWQDLVSFAVEREYWGIENLALIPGTVGAAPMQNIGAYGAELKDVLDTVEAYDIYDGSKRVFRSEECRLGYRDSIFKNELKGKYFISAVTLRLSKERKLNLAYKTLREHLEKLFVSTDGIRPLDVSLAVSYIRKSKLPDPASIPNAGSFFKNVFISRGKMEELLKTYPDMPHFTEDEEIKIPAGWLIEKCGWKGKRVGNAAVHDKQALVLVNKGGATGEEIRNLAEDIIASVFRKFNLKLVPEVNLI